MRLACQQHRKSCKPPASVLAITTMHASKTQNIAVGLSVGITPSLENAAIKRSLKSSCSYDFVKGRCNTRAGFYACQEVGYWAVRLAIACQALRWALPLSTCSKLSGFQELQSPSSLWGWVKPQVDYRVDTEINHPVRSQTKPRPYRE